MNLSALPRFSGRGALILMAVAVGLLGVLVSHDSAHASFNPEATVTVPDTAAGANSDIQQAFNIKAPDVNFSGVVFFIPPEWGVSVDADVTDGAVVGKLDAQATLGLIGGGCNSQLAVSFTMLEATTSTATTVPFTDPEVTAGNPAGDTEGDADDQFDVVDGLPLGVTRMPDYLPRIFPDTPFRARQYGQTLVAGIAVSLNFVIFEPGTNLRGTLPTDPRLGYPSVTVLQSLGDPDAKPLPSTINDFCAPLVSNPLAYGVSQDNPDTAANEAGDTVRTNPSAAGTYPFTTFAAGLRDADGDGWENLMDLCPFDADTTWNPRVTVVVGQPGDADGDRLPDVCDPDPNVQSPIIGGLHDEDEDGYGNRQDNCPLVANSAGVPNGSGPDNQADRDGDQIGDACDPNPDDPDGDLPFTCLTTNIDIGGGGTPAIDPATVLPCDPTAQLPSGDTGGSPTPTLPPGATPRPTSTGGGTGIGGAGGSGIGSLSPVGGSVPVWAAVLAGLGALGVLGGFSLAGWSIRRRE